MTIREIRFCDLCNKSIKSKGSVSSTGVEFVRMYETYAGVDLHPGCYERVEELLRKVGVPKFESIVETDRVGEEK